jgi:putative membrane protein
MTEGDEPDYRFTLANERTFLAWVRTSLGLLAAGVAVRFITASEGEGGRTALAVAAVALSGVIVVLAYLRWAGAQRAMRLGRPLPASLGVPLLTAALAAVAVVAAIVVVIG